MSTRRYCLVLLALCVSGLYSPRARACGVSADGAWSCSLEEHEEEERPRWQLGAAGQYTTTALRFDGDRRAEQTRGAVLAVASYAPARRLRFQASAGLGLGGAMQLEEREYDMLPGPALGAGVSYTLLEGRPFVAVSGALGATFARTESDGERASYTALDLRLGVMAGTVLFEVLTPYLVARVFGGPVFWSIEGESVTGTDVHHYQLGAGLSLRPMEWWSLSFEGVPLGEQALSGAVVFSF
ncbi:MAG TPA: hypothetical protein VJR89_31015 [Polyangiales bacterium]|nr:hypothetical protein [Polyangiales bacterium]